MTALHTTVRSFINEHSLSNSTIIVGLSGGPDSIALLSVVHDIASDYDLTLIAAHLDHQWRTDSHDDLLFCKRFATTRGIEFISRTASDLDLTLKKSSGEEHGRKLRRTFFEEVAHTYNAQAIALGHHADDQQETFFLRMMRGASIAGLASMKPKSGLYIRPLLAHTKRELLEYLHTSNLPYRKDSTNDDTTHLRNALRHTVIPALRSCDTRFDVTFFKTLKTVQETDEYLERVTQDTFSSITQKTFDAVQLDRTAFLQIDEFLHHRVLVKWLCSQGVPFTPSRAFFDEVIRFIKNPGKTHLINPSWRLVKSGSHVSIQREERG